MPLVERLLDDADTRGRAEDALGDIETVPSEPREHELLLVRVRHPAARTRKGSVSWLLAQRDFRAATTALR